MKRLRLLGHPLHPLSVHFPLGLLLCSSCLDLAIALGAPEAWAPHALAMLICGLVTALPALLTGVLDYVTIPQGSANSRLATSHMAVALLGVAAYGATLAIRSGRPQLGSLGLVATLSGAACLGAAGWMGGELVYGRGEGLRRHQPRSDGR